MVEGKKLSFDILYDQGNQTAHKLGIVFTVADDVKEIYTSKMGINLTETNGDDSWELPMPARYIIDKEGIIQYADISPNYTSRPEPSDTLKALKQL